MAHRILDFGNKSALRRDLLCNHSNSDLFMCEDNMLLSHVKISCFCVKAHLLFHWWLYNKYLLWYVIHVMQQLMDI